MRRVIDQAKIFGEIRMCLKRDERPLGMGMILNRLRSTLKDYEEGDYILWAGGEWPVLVALGVVLKEMNIPAADLLVWSTKFNGEGTYVPQRMVL